MAHFNLENDINNLIRMEAPLTQGPLPRWNRKALIETASSTSTSFNHSLSQSFSKTPKKLGTSIVSTTPSRTPKKTPGRTKTPGRKTPNVGGKSRPSSPNGGDRFIPNRSNSLFELGHYKIVQKQENEASDDIENQNAQEMKRVVSENLNMSNARILSYSVKPASVPEGYTNSLKVLYSQGKAPPSNKKSRYIPQKAEKILDAPDLLDDYYLNILDWGVNNLLAVALCNNVFLWDANTGEIQQLVELESQGDYVCSLSWIKEGQHIAVGTNTGEVQLWDVERVKRLRIMGGHASRVGSLSWNSYILSSGSKSGAIHHHDVRVSEHLVKSINQHTQEVCGLTWSPDGKYLASGGNDNIINIWSSLANQFYTDSVPLHTFTEHQAAVKALAWCPWQPNVLASGGGMADRCIKFWNCNTGVCLNTLDTKNQVCGLVWSASYKELISGHGFPNNQLSIWKYPSMEKVCDLSGHTARLLNLALSPDGTTVASTAADETLRLWKCFEMDPKSKKNEKMKECGKSVLQRGGIR